MSVNGCPESDCPQGFEDGFCAICGKAEASVALSLSPATSSGSSSVTRQGSTTQVGGYARDIVSSATRIWATSRQAKASKSTGTNGTSGTQGTGGTSGTGSSRRGSKGSSSRRRALGGGLVMIPPMPTDEPMKRIMINARIPDKKAHCPSCDAQVNPDKKYCSNCGANYNFKPTLKAGDIVANQYEIKGAMAFGGMGWIYLGWDKRLDRWVVLKGLLNSKDESAAQAANAERQILSSLKHGRIVGIYNFVKQGEDSYIVMEYVGGRTLNDVRKERGPLPVEEAISYILGLMPAFDYLHTLNLIYCDMKPDNVMLENDDVKLIDLGAVRAVDSQDGDIFFTNGYMAPEAKQDPSVSSDLFTLGRTLASLIIDFDNTKKYQYTIPNPYEVTRELTFGDFKNLGLDALTDDISFSATLPDGSPLPSWLSFSTVVGSTRRVYFKGEAPFGTISQPTIVKAFRGAELIAQYPLEVELPLAKHESLYRFLLKSTASTPEERFTDIEEMSSQLLGVLRDVVAVTKPVPSIESIYFGSERDSGIPAIWDKSYLRLPSLKLDKDDPCVDAVTDMLSQTDPVEREALAVLLGTSHHISLEANFRLVDELIQSTDKLGSKSSPENTIMKHLEYASELDAYDWRIEWYAGKFYLANNQFDEAIMSFDRVYFELPGEPMPRIALALALEAKERYNEAAFLYEKALIVAPEISLGVFGLARCYRYMGDKQSAFKAYERIPTSSSRKNHAVMASIATLADLKAIFLEKTLTPEVIYQASEDLYKAAQILEKTGADTLERHEAEAELALRAAKLSEISKKTLQVENLFTNIKNDAKSLRHHAETCLRRCARLAQDTTQRHMYVDWANLVRPRTLI